MADRTGTYEEGSLKEKFENALNEFITSIPDSTMGTALDVVSITSGLIMGQLARERDRRKAIPGLNPTDIDPGDRIQNFFWNVANARDKKPISDMVQFFNQKVFGGRNADGAKKLVDGLQNASMNDVGVGGKVSDITGFIEKWASTNAKTNPRDNGFLSILEMFTPKQSTPSTGPQLNDAPTYMDSLRQIGQGINTASQSKTSSWDDIVGYPNPIGRLAPKK